MKAVNIYALTRLDGAERLSKLERQMSGRRSPMKIKEWEMEGLKRLCDKLLSFDEDISLLEFFYSFNMPKLGKEFDLLRVDDDSIINIELKSGNVSDEAIKRQLIQNRYYLATLGRSMYFFTYITEGDRLVRLSGNGRLLEAEPEELVNLLKKQKGCASCDIEEFFKEDRYLISPLTDPARFLRREYFLTFQQRDIEKHILERIKKREGEPPVQGFTGLPGTGKTLLLYDLAMQLSYNDPVAVLHFGAHEKELEQLDERLKRIDFCYCETGTVPELKREYKYILVDEGHHLGQDSLKRILELSKKMSAPVVISYDREDVISGEVLGETGAELIEKIPGFTGYRLTNRIRLNTEISSFIACLMHRQKRQYRRDNNSVKAVYASGDKECKKILGLLCRRGYTYIGSSEKERSVPDEEMYVEASAAACREFDRVVMVIDESFAYDEAGYLRCRNSDSEKSVRNLYHGLSRAKKGIALIVCNNTEVMDEVLDILQG